MKLNKLLIISFVLFFFLNNCTTLNEAGNVLRNEKTASTDEFLIKKKGPLTQPPDFENMPVPSSSKEEAGSEKKSIQNILKTKQTNAKNNQIKPSSTEQSILKKFKSEK